MVQKRPSAPKKTPPGEKKLPFCAPVALRLEMFGVAQSRAICGTLFV